MVFAYQIHYNKLVQNFEKSSPEFTPSNPSRKVGLQSRMPVLEYLVACGSSQPASL